MLSRWNILVILSLVLFWFSLSPNLEAKSKTRKPAAVKKTTPSVKQVPMPGDGPIAKQTWFEWLRSDLAEDMCQDGSYLRTCFGFNQKNCTRSMHSEITTCWSKESMHWRQSQVHPRKEGVTMAYFVGKCAGTGIEKRFKTKKQNTDDCRSMKKWMGR